jgi:hypothetical protein
MKTLTATALVLALAAPALAQSGGGGGSLSAAMAERADELIRTRDITGGDVFTLDAADDAGWDVDTVHDSVAPGWSRIGEVEDIVLDREGEMQGIVAEVGGFLDVADKHVLVSVDDANLVAVDGARHAFVTRLDEAELEALPDVDEGFWD